MTVMDVQVLVYDILMFERIQIRVVSRLFPFTDLGSVFQTSSHPVKKYPIRVFLLIHTNNHYII